MIQRYKKMLCSFFPKILYCYSELLHDFLMIILVPADIL